MAFTYIMFKHQNIYIKIIWNNTSDYQLNYTCNKIIVYVFFFNLKKIQYDKNEQLETICQFLSGLH